MAVTKRLRYEVLRRDNYTCRYCGASAPDVKLTVDHVTPVALGGRDESANLVTACEPCNTGKTSTTPGAPLVENVAADALRWAQAVKAASSQMLADLKARQQIHADFEKAWSVWPAARGKGPVLLPPGWRDTVDAFIGAGLPWPVLAECITKAMTRDKVKADDKFRYMCGIAWSKVNELQESARLSLGEHAGLPAAGPAMEDTVRVVRDRLAEALLNLMDEHLTAADVSYDMINAVVFFDGREGPDPILAIVEQVLRHLRTQPETLALASIALLEELPEGVGHQAMQVERHNLYNQRGSDFTLPDFAYEAVSTAVEMLSVRDDLAFLDRFTPEAQAEWFAYAETFVKVTDTKFGSSGLAMFDAVMRLDYVRAVVEAVQSGYVEPAMCRGRGKHIEACPERVQYRLVHDDGQASRVGFCAAHMESFKGYVAPGQSPTYRDVEELGDSR
ncbi:HNH endonuclease [Microbispora bryophytorum]|uniref:HNH endonuclease n=1 Tax=Microbispora bryophytorum TaxID=1460882 RepID=UPI00340F7B7D